LAPGAWLSNSGVGAFCEVAGAVQDKSALDVLGVDSTTGEVRVEYRRTRSLTEYLGILNRRKALIFLWTAGMLLATWQILEEVPNTYESRAILIISERESKATDAMDSHFAAVRQEATGARILESIVDHHHLRGAKESTDSAINRLRQQIKIETKLPVLTLSYRHTDPRLAQSVLAEVVAGFDQANDAIRKQAAAEASWLDSQIAKMEGQFAKIGLSRVIPVSTPGAATDLKTARATLNAAMDSLSDKQYALQQEIAEQERQIAAQRGIVASAQSAPGAQDAAYGALLVRKTELEAQLMEYASQYTAKNVKVVQAKAQLAEISGQLAALEAKNQPGSAAVAPAIHELFTLERDLIRLRTDFEITAREIRRKTAALENLPRVDLAASDEKGMSEIETKGAYDRLISRYNSLVAQRDLVQKAGVLDDGGAPVIRISDPPNLPQDPAGPNRRLLKAIALAFALGTGLLIGGVVEARRLFFFQDHRDVVYFLETPLLVTIPETLTPIERSLKSRYMLARTLGVVLLISAMPATVLTLKHFDLLKKVVPLFVR